MLLIVRATYVMSYHRQDEIYKHLRKPIYVWNTQIYAWRVNPLAALVVELGLKRFAAPATSAAEFVNAGMPGQNTKGDCLHLDSAGLWS